MIFGELFPEMVGSAQALYMYIKSNEFSEEVLDKLCPIKHLSQDCAEDLFRSYLELRSKDQQVIGFVCAYPEYNRCDDNVWHGTIDGKINATRLAINSINRTDRYSCGEKLMIMRDGLSDFVSDAMANAVTASNFEYTLEDTYYESKYTFLTQNGFGSPSSLIADGFGNAGDVLTRLSDVAQLQKAGAATAFGVFARRSLDVVKRRFSPNDTGFTNTQSTQTIRANVIGLEEQRRATLNGQNITTQPSIPEGRIIETESIRVPSLDDSFIK